MRVFTWAFRILSLACALLILQRQHGVGLAGCILVSLATVTWNVCAHVDAKEERS